MELPPPIPQADTESYITKISKVVIAHLNLNNVESHRMMKLIMYSHTKF